MLLPSIHQHPLPLAASPTALPALHCLPCLFVCSQREGENVLLPLPAEHALLAALANCCLLSSNASVCVCVFVCVGVLTLYKLLIIMSPAAYVDMIYIESLAWLFYAESSYGCLCVSLPLSMSLSMYPWQSASGMSGCALIMCRMSSPLTLFPLFYRLLRCWR